MTSTACSNCSTSSSPSSRRNLKRLIDARLQAESSIDMYSEHGFDALMRPVFGSVCHWLIVVSYWTPGSAHFSAACMNASVTRTELLAFWYWIDAQSGESSDMS